ncbi:hypothetical protein [Kamptonema sp. UHCC 0994]|uniref:hypothetical protein n=1 Tax=Kamptonema sp. UHCC 0994 TaxID=3031329 RepID=UPI0023B9E473|nr:hypothetical protein [Kamptonema sp. UHCC 0994]MDF0554537.1 hypothetical protein [Kamptonema sp. UHCC 0994]
MSFDSQFHFIYVDGSHVFDYNGHTYYNRDGSIAGTWACASNHHAYTAGGKDLGYAPTEEDAVMLVYKHRN